MDHSQHPRPTLWAEMQFDWPTDISEKDTLLHHLATFPSQCSITLESIPHEKLNVRHDGKWSIQEHLGHLLDMDDLPSKRIIEILADKSVMTAADMDNRHTWDQNYNDHNIYEICERFIGRRRILVDLFKSVPEEKWLASANHERLNRQMSILDLAYFQGQHDHYHQEMMLYLATK